MGLNVKTSPRLGGFLNTINISLENIANLALDKVIIFNNCITKSESIHRVKTFGIHISHTYICIFFFETGFLCCPGCLRTHYVNQMGLELRDLPTFFSECWDQRCVVPYLIICTYFKVCVCISECIYTYQNF